MFLHLGGEISVSRKEVIGIFDVLSTKKSPITKEFLDLAITEKKLVKISGAQEAKSFVVTKDKVYYSPISSVTLQKRSRIFFQEG